MQVPVPALKVRKALAQKAQRARPILGALIEPLEHERVQRDARDPGQRQITATGALLGIRRVGETEQTRNETTFSLAREQLHEQLCGLLELRGRFRERGQQQVRVQNGSVRAQGANPRLFYHLLRDLCVGLLREG